MKRNNRIDLLNELVRTSFKLKYNGSFLGFLWVIAKPFMQFLILYIVFSGNKSNIENYTIYLLLGLIIFSFFQEGFMLGLNSLREKAHIILKVNFDKTLVIYSAISLAIINMLVNFLIVFIFIIFNPLDTNLIAVLYALGVILLLVIFLIGVSFFTSIISIKIRDLQHIAEVGLQLLFYASAIFFSVEIIPEKFRFIVDYNPVYIVIQSVRTALISGEIINLDKIFILTLLTLVMTLWGFLFFRHRITKVAEYF